jgi:hypothetical protein
MVVQVAGMGKQEFALAAALVLMGAPLAVLSDVPSPWNFVVAGALAVAGLVLIWKYLSSPAVRAEPTAHAIQPARKQPVDARSQAQRQRDVFRQRRSELEVATQGADCAIRVLDLSGNPPTKLLEIVEAGTTYRLKFSSSGGESVWVYGDDPSVKSIAVERFAQRGEAADVPSLRPERGAANVVINQRVFATTQDDRVIQALILSVRYYNAGDDRDEVRVCYSVYPAGEFLIPAP